MKRKKNLTMLLSFCLGAVLFISTAFADVVSKTGYDQFKDAIKNTMGSLEKGYDSFTAETALSIKDNDKTLMTNTSTIKYDMANSRMEEVSIQQCTGNRNERYYSYRDNWCNIYNRYTDEDTYYINEYENEMKDAVKFDNFFEDEDAQYIERIFDAMIGNLKEYVIVGENSDGSKEFSGKLSDAQIPALINAVTAYAAKQSVFDDQGANNEFEIPAIKSDVFVKEISGRANTDEAGIIENLFAELILSGSEKDGTEHELKLEMVFKIYNINSTSVVRPDLTGKKVEKNVVKTEPDRYVSEKYLGKWKNDIIIEESNEFVKIGERVIEITSIDDSYVYGTYTEIYKEEYADYDSGENNYSFKADMYENKGELESTDSSGNVLENGFIYFGEGRIECRISIEEAIDSNMLYNPTFNKVFEE